MAAFDSAEFALNGWMRKKPYQHVFSNKWNVLPRNCCAWCVLMLLNNILQHICFHVVVNPGLNLPPITCDILFDNLQNSKSFNRLLYLRYPNIHAFYGGTVFCCSFFCCPPSRYCLACIVTRIQLIFCCAHKIFQSIIQDGAILIVFKFFCVCVFDVRAWLLVVVFVTVVALFSMPFNNFINYAFSSLTNNIAKVFFVYSLSNDLKSIKCCRTLKWYLPFFYFMQSTNTRAHARTHINIYTALLLRAQRYEFIKLSWTFTWHTIHSLLFYWFNIPNPPTYPSHHPMSLFSQNEI